MSYTLWSSGHGSRRSIKRRDTTGVAIIGGGGHHITTINGREKGVADSSEGLHFSGRERVDIQGLLLSPHKQSLCVNAPQINHHRAFFLLLLFHLLHSYNQAKRKMCFAAVIKSSLLYWSCKLIVIIISAHSEGAWRKLVASHIYIYTKRSRSRSEDLRGWKRRGDEKQNCVNQTGLLIIQLCYYNDTTN